VRISSFSVGDALVVLFSSSVDLYNQTFLNIFHDVKTKAKKIMLLCIRRFE